MTNPDTQDAEGLALAGRIELHPLRETRLLTENARGECEHRQPRVRRAPNPDGRSWRTEDEQ